MKHNLLLAIFATAVMAGCASTPAPVVAPAPENTQKRLVAAQQWGAVAADVAAQTKASISQQDFLQGRLLHVVPFSKAPFDQAFTNYMITSLVNAGLPVTPNPEGAVELKYETQIITHNASLGPRGEGYVPVAASGATGGGRVMRNAQERQVAPPAKTVSAAKALDSQATQTWPANVELLIATSIIDNDQYLQRSTDAYFIEAAEAELFMPPVEAAQAKPRVLREWKVTQ